jgi:hypothetical protein
MAIKINLLAEAQELEDLRRRDPVKRFVLGGVILIVMILVWSSSLMVKAMIIRSDVARLESEAKSRESAYKQILESQNQLVETKRKLLALDRLSTNRFLVGTLLNTLQKNTLDNVRLVRLKLDQSYVLVPEVKPAKGQKGIIPKPATVKENVTVPSPQWTKVRRWETASASSRNFCQRNPIFKLFWTRMDSDLPRSAPLKLIPTENPSCSWAWKENYRREFDEKTK